MIDEKEFNEELKKAINDLFYFIKDVEKSIRKIKILINATYVAIICCSLSYIINVHYGRIFISGFMLLCLIINLKSLGINKANLKNLNEILDKLLISLLRGENNNYE